jgi:hypothetical protein
MKERKKETNLKRYRERTEIINGCYSFLSIGKQAMFPGDLQVKRHLYNHHFTVTVTDTVTITLTTTSSPSPPPTYHQIISTKVIIMFVQPIDSEVILRHQERDKSR